MLCTMNFETESISGSTLEASPAVASGALFALHVNLRELRGEMTFADAARRTGLDRDELKRIEKGETRSIGFATIVKLCEGLRCDLSDLMTLEPVTMETSSPLYTGALAAFAKGQLRPAPRRRVPRDLSSDVMDLDAAQSMEHETTSRARRRGIPTLNR